MLPLVSQEALRAEIAVLKNKLAEAEEYVKQLRQALLPLGWEPPVELRLTKNESLLVGCLFNMNGDVALKERIYYTLYSNRLEQPDPKVVDVFVCKVRKKLAAHGIFIETVRSKGFRLTHDSIALLNGWETVSSLPKIN